MMVFRYIKILWILFAFINHQEEDLNKDRFADYETKNTINVNNDTNQ